MADPLEHLLALLLEEPQLEALLELDLLDVPELEEMLLGRVDRVEVLENEAGYVVALGVRAARGAGLDAAALAVARAHAPVGGHVEALQESVTDDSDFCGRGQGRDWQRCFFFVKGWWVENWRSVSLIGI